MLYDKEFLLKLDQQSNKTIYARITALTFQETPIEYIEGRVTQGSINIDGASAVRRSCSLTMVAEDFRYDDYYWGLNSKFKLEIGIKNIIDSDYPDIIWFKQGIYLITSFNTSRSTNNFSISIQGKDKMCLLNGEIGGSLESSVDFGTIEEEDKDGNWVIRKIPIPEIIKNAVHTYAGEPYHNIIINDLDTYGLELLEYRYDIPMYLYRAITGPDSSKYDGMTFDGNKPCSVSGKPKIKKLADLGPSELEMLVDRLKGSTNPAKVRIEGNYYYVAKVEYGQTAGYRMTDLVYAGDLVANIGESLTSVLDKIKNMLSEFEYFYNLDGQFVFQKKQSFKNTMLKIGNNTEDSSAMEGIAMSSAHAYEFYGGELVTAFNNNPNLLNVRNDYSIWGEKETISGAKIPIHLRYAIDQKPIQYRNIRVFKTEVDAYNKKYNTKLKAQGDSAGAGEAESQLRYTYIASSEYSIDKTKRKIRCDWREVIYQMAKDYYRYNFLDDFELRVAAANPDLYPAGRTGYEQYYTDLQGFWRELYYPLADDDFQELETNVTNQKKKVEELTIEVYGTPIEGFANNVGGLQNEIVTLSNKINESLQIAKEFIRDEWNSKNHHPSIKDDENNPIEDPEYYLSMLQDLFFRTKNILEKAEYELEDMNKKYEELKEQITVNFYAKEDDDSVTSENRYWSRSVFEAPDQLIFWFDFLDTSGELQQFSVRRIGVRPKSINDTNVKAIYFRETPSIIYIDPNDEEISYQNGYRYIQAPDENMFSCSARGKSAKDRLNELIYWHGYCTESATITTIPIYYLNPNTRIYLHDADTGLDGDFITSKITIPLTYNGTMSITATKAAENIL